MAKPRKVQSPDGTVHEVASELEFCRKHRLHPAAFVKVLNGTRKQISGWKLPDHTNH